MNFPDGISAEDSPITTGNMKTMLYVLSGVLQGKRCEMIPDNNMILKGLTDTGRQSLSSIGLTDQTYAKPAGLKRLQVEEFIDLINKLPGKLLRLVNDQQNLLIVLACFPEQGMDTIMKIPTTFHACRYIKPVCNQIIKFLPGQTGIRDNSRPHTAAQGIQQGTHNHALTAACVAGQQTEAAMVFQTILQDLKGFIVILSLPEEIGIGGELERRPVQVIKL